MIKALRWFLKELSGANDREFWEEQLREQRERHAREILARLDMAGVISPDDSTIDGLRTDYLRKREGQEGE